jgi:hypothetical protein
MRTWSAASWWTPESVRCGGSWGGWSATIRSRNPQRHRPRGRRRPRAVPTHPPVPALVPRLPLRHRGAPPGETLPWTAPSPTTTRCRRPRWYAALTGSSPASCGRLSGTSSPTEGGGPSSTVLSSCWAKRRPPRRLALPDGGGAGHRGGRTSGHARRGPSMCPAPGGGSPRRGRPSWRPAPRGGTAARGAPGGRRRRLRHCASGVG